MRKLPPLAAVRVFEAAARHQTFTAAAEELGSVKLADGGTCLITGSVEGARVWPLSTERLSTLAEATAGRTLSAAERSSLPKPPPEQPTLAERFSSWWRRWVSRSGESSR